MLMSEHVPLSGAVRFSMGDGRSDNGAAAARSMAFKSSRWRSFASGCEARFTMLVGQTSDLTKKLMIDTYRISFYVQ